MMNEVLAAENLAKLFCGIVALASILFSQVAYRIERAE